MDIKQSLKSFDWRILKKYTSSEAMNDLNRFLENMPHHVSQSMLIAAGCAWLMAGTVGLFTVVKVQELTELRVEFEEAKAVNPTIPKIENLAVSTDSVDRFVGRLDKFYRGLTISSQGSRVTLQGNQVTAFAEFREAVGHVLNGGQGWRVTVDEMCVGRECKKAPLSTTLRINKVSVSNPNQK